MIASCGKDGKVENEQFAFLNKQGITITQKLLLGDTLSLSDIYSGDENQSDNEIDGEKLNPDHYAALILRAVN